MSWTLRAPARRVTLRAAPTRAIVGLSVSLGVSSMSVGSGAAVPVHHATHDMWLRSGTPLTRACRSILDAVSEDGDALRDDGAISSRTRSSSRGAAHVEEHHDVLCRNHARTRVRHFAHEVRSLPMRDGHAIRRIGRVDLTVPNVVWRQHGSGRSQLEHHRLLPRLHSVSDDDSATPLHLSYAPQRELRRRGKSYALWQMAESGAVTLPHVDDDIRGVTMATYFAVVEGAQLIVAWRRDELHEDDVLRDVDSPTPSLDRLLTVPSLTTLRAVTGDLLYMPRDVVHMVVTEKRKIHFAFHIYE